MIPLSIQNNIIYSSLVLRRGYITRFCVLVESRSIFFSSKIAYLKVDWFTRYNGIKTEH